MGFVFCDQTTFSIRFVVHSELHQSTSWQSSLDSVGIDHFAYDVCYKYNPREQGQGREGQGQEGRGGGEEQEG